MAVFQIPWMRNMPESREIGELTRYSVRVTYYELPFGGCHCIAVIEGAVTGGAVTGGTVTA